MADSDSSSGGYKRHQVEGVLWALLSGPGRTARDRLNNVPPPFFKARLKRLLDTDVSLGRALGVQINDFGMAFFDKLPKGKGTDVAYAPGKVLNLAIGLQLVGFGCKPKEVVEALAENRDTLQTIFDEMNKAIEVSGRSRLNKNVSQSGEREARFLVLRHVEAPHDMELQNQGHVSEGETILNFEIAISKEGLSKLIEHTMPKDVTQLHVMELAELSARITELLLELPARSRGPRISV